ncbi:MAG TPA: GNAT family N-acetyltransferase [Thermomicrobiales bacterium]|nr:GNAT family N-acetyltransferase [Thermomicrobiales bacterium]
MTDTATTHDIRLVDVSNTDWLSLGTYAFSASPADITDEEREYAQAAAESRIFMSYEGESPLAQVIVHPMTMNVRDAVLPMGGVSGVASMPAGRRGGRIRTLLTRSFAQMREDGQPVSALYPFRESFYERMGFVSLAAPKLVNLNPSHLQGLMKMDIPGRSEHFRLADGFDRWVDFLRAYERENHGFSVPNGPRLEAMRKRNRWWLILVTENDETTGAMLYRIEGEHKPMTVHSFLSRTVAARYRLLEWIARHTDQVQKARLRVSPTEQPEFWWYDLDDAIQADGEGSWGPGMARIVSLDRLTGLAAGTGDVTLEITDPHCPWNEGIWTLRGSGGKLEIVPGGDPVATLPIQGLNALVFNGLDPEILPFRNWGNVDDATADRLRALFPPALAWLHEHF